VSKPSKTDALTFLRDSLNEVQRLKQKYGPCVGDENQEIKNWKEKTEVDIEYIFSEKPDRLKKFKELRCPRQFYTP